MLLAPWLGVVVETLHGGGPILGVRVRVISDVGDIVGFLDVVHLRAFPVTLGIVRIPIEGL